MFTGLAKWALIVLLVIAGFSAFTNALSLNSDADHVSIRGTEGKVFVWVVNTDGIRKTIALSADLGAFNGFFEDSGLEVQGSGSSGSWLHVSAPLCFRGVQQVPIKAEVCDQNGRCEVLRKTILVSATPASQCTNYDNHPPFHGGFDAGFKYGDGSLAGSTLDYASFYDPTEYQVSITGPQQCVQIKPGQHAREQFSVFNRGAGSSYDVRVSDSQGGVGAIAAPSTLSLHRGEVQDVGVDMVAQLVPSGRHYLSLQVVRNGMVVADKSICVDVLGVVDSTVKLPARINTKVCEDTSFQGIIENTGTIGNSFQIFVPGQASASPSMLQVNPGESQVFNVNIPANTLVAGESDFVVTAKTSYQDLAGQAAVKVIAEPCVLPTPAETVTQNNNVLTITVSVVNEFTTPLMDVSATVEGIPPSWTVTSTRIAKLNPGETGVITVTVTQNTNEDAPNPVLVVKSGNTEIARKSLAPIKASGVTGLFTALTPNLPLILVLILIAILAIAFFGARGRSTTSESTTTKSETVMLHKEAPAPSAPTSRQNFVETFKRRLRQIRSHAAK